MEDSELLERCRELLQQLEVVSLDGFKACPVCEGEWDKREKMVYHETDCELELLLLELQDI